MYATESVRGSTIYEKLLGIINKKICSVSGSNRNNLTPAIPKPADFQREMSSMPTIRKRSPEEGDVIR